MNASIQIAIAAFLLFISVATGAFGSHALSNHVELPLLAVWETAVQYLALHSVAMLGLAAAQPFLHARLQALGFNLLFVGSLLFSGSLYLLVLSAQRWLAFITPVGGVLLLGGWLVIVAAALKHYAQTKQSA